MHSDTYKRYLLAILTATFLFNLVDRWAFGLVLQDIKTDLSLSDTQLGLLTGIAFALFYSIMGVPIARWADRGNRVLIICAATALWSIAVAGCGLATTFVQLLLIRILVAIGEAGCNPPAMSLMAEHFARHERARATSIYATGSALSFVAGFFIAGWLNEIYGWRAMMMVLAAPGVVLAIIAGMTLREPRHRKSQLASTSDEQCAAPNVPVPSFVEVCTTLWRNVTFRHVLLYMSAISFFGYGIVQWQPTFFIRSFGVATSELGMWLTAIYTIGGLLGTYLSGSWVARRAAGNEQLQLRISILFIGGSGVLSTLTYVAQNMYASLLFAAFTNVAFYMVNSLVLAIQQTLVPERMRAVSFALVHLMSHLIGMGLGPLATGTLSDALTPAFAAESLRYALLILSPGYLWGAFHLWRASRSVAMDLGDVHVEQNHPVPEVERKMAMSSQGAAS